MGLRISYPKEQLEEFSKKWKVKTLFAFGSALRSDFDESQSDIDILVDFLPEASWTLLDHVSMKDELENIFNRPVDLLTKRSVEKSRNEARKREILNNAQVIYDSAAE